MKLPKFMVVLLGLMFFGHSVLAGSLLIYTPYTITTLASTATFATNSNPTRPTGIAVDGSGNVFVTDSSPSQVLYMASPQGNISIIAGGGPFASDGTNQDAGFAEPTGLAIDASGNLFVVDTATSKIRKVTHVGTNWVVTTIATGFNQPQGVAVDSAGNLYVADTGDSTIQEIVPDGTNWTATTIAGLAGQGGLTDGTNDAARFVTPTAIAVDRDGNLYVSDLNTLIRKITPVGTNWVVTTMITRSGELDRDGTNSIRPIVLVGIDGLSADSAGNLYVTQEGTVRRITPFGSDCIGTTLVGGYYRFADGPGANGAVFNATGIAVDAAGTLYIADTGNQAIRVARPALQYAATNNQFVFTWPTTPPGGYALQSSTNLGPGAAWVPLTNGIVTNGVDFVLTNTIDTNIQGVFFRIAHP